MWHMYNQPASPFSPFSFVISASMFSSRATLLSQHKSYLILPFAPTLQTKPPSRVFRVTSVWCRELFHTVCGVRYTDKQMCESYIAVSWVARGPQPVCCYGILRNLTSSYYWSRLCYESEDFVFILNGSTSTPSAQLLVTGQPAGNNILYTAIACFL